MNIFASSPNPETAAITLDNKRVVKMVLETAQILSSAAHLNGYHNHRLYRPTHTGHPCVLWASRSRRNAAWLLMHFDALASTYTRRYQRVHRSTMIRGALVSAIKHLPDRPIEPFQNSARHASLGLDFSALPVHQAYRTYLCERWRTDKLAPDWGCDPVPSFFSERLAA